MKTAEDIAWEIAQEIHLSSSAYAAAVPARTEQIIAAALRAYGNARVEEAALVADSFTCGGCGMDGKSGQDIRAFKEKEPGT